jgi:hypothetical protein
MPERLLSHLKHNLVAYVALFVAIGGSSYAAVQLTPGSVRTRALAARAVTHSKLANNSVTSQNVANHSLTRADVARGLVRRGARGPAGPAGRNGGAFVGARARSSGTVQAPHGATTNVPLSGGGWTQGANEVDLIAGTMTVKTPATCTGSFGNALVVKVDGQATTFGMPPQGASTTVTLPILVGTLTEPGASTKHQMTAALGNSCTKQGEDFAVSNVKLDVLKFN